MAENQFKVSDEVRIKKLSQDGKVLEVTSRGTYRVAVGSMTLEVKASEMSRVPESKWKKATKNLKNPKVSVQGKILTEKMPEILDLHGLRVEEALPKVAHFLDQAILQDKDLALILHGLGTGKLLQAVHAFLKKTPTVKHFELDSHNPGVTKVYF